MRIAMAAPLYLPDFRGGAIQVCRSLSGSLREAGNSVALLAGCATPDVPVGATEREILDGFPVWRTNLGDALDAFSPSGFHNPEAQAGFAEFLEQARPDLGPCRRHASRLVVVLSMFVRIIPERSSLSDAAATRAMFWL